MSVAWSLALGWTLLLGCPPTADPSTDAGATDRTGPTDAAIGDTAAPTTHTGDTPGDGTGTGCVPTTCDAAGADCGVLDDGCGATLDCGGCAPWSACGTVTPNTCTAADCVPFEQASTDGGGRCDDLDQAWTARGINVGYYPFRVLRETIQISGDFSGATTDPTYTPGPTTAGVVLQRIPAGAFVALSSTGPYYDPSAACWPGDGCGDPDEAACQDSTPPLRPGIAGYYWGYAYSGASHVQGWIYADPTSIAYAGDDPTHPCALGPAGADYEVHEACGAPTTCAGSNPTCGEVNRCDEGRDDCASTACGATSGGALTPSAHAATVTWPAGAHPCTTRTPPDPSVYCLDNGAEVDFFFVYPHGAYLYWAQNSTTKHWLHYGDAVQSYFHSRDEQGVLWAFVEVVSSGAPTLTPPSDGAGAIGCTADDPSTCHPCLNGGTCGWVQEVFAP
ncbi:MAG: hypothetical protein ABMB14_00135 [Myxococcota bacterium]